MRVINLFQQLDLQIKKEFFGINNYKNYFKIRF